MKRLKEIVPGCVLILMMAVASASYAVEKTPVGLWKTIDDHTGLPRGLVRIAEFNGEFQARVKNFFPSPVRI